VTSDTDVLQLAQETFFIKVLGHSWIQACCLDIISNVEIVMRFASNFEQQQTS